MTASEPRSKGPAATSICNDVPPISSRWVEATVPENPGPCCAVALANPDEAIAAAITDTQKPPGRSLRIAPLSACLIGMPSRGA
jgi:hypothetical protein